LGCNWAGDISLGGRYADVTSYGDFVQFEDTIGPVIGLHLKSKNMLYGINGFGNVRYSHQFGQGDDDFKNLASFSITEVQLGFEYAKSSGYGSLFARAFFEAQKWEGDFDNSDEDIGLIGYGLAVGITR
jgi:hypothetical protein